MGLVATLREIEKTSTEELNRLNPNRPVMVDGSLSELVTQALNVAYSKRDMTTGEPFYGQRNKTGEMAPGAGNAPNIFKPDEPRQDPGMVKPDLQGMQQMQAQQISEAAAVLYDAVNAHDQDAMSMLKEAPLVVYAIPHDGQVTEEMNSSVDMYGDSGAVNINDFVFVYTDSNDTVGDMDTRMVDINQKVKNYEQKGAKVYGDMESFLRELPELRRK